MTNHEQASEGAKQDIQDRIEQLQEIADIFSGSAKGEKALKELAEKRAELAQFEQPSGRQDDAPAPERAKPKMAPEKKQQIEQQESHNEDLADMMSELLYQSGSSPDLNRVLEKLRDPQNVQDFLEDSRGTEFFLQGVRDIRAKKTANTALEKFYTQATKRPYQQERAA